MDLQTILSYFFDYFVPIVLGLIILFLTSRRLIKTAKMYMGMKSYVKNAIKLDRKKFNGLNLVEKIKRKRKRNTNTYQQLRGRAKRDVKKYFTHKVEEIPVCARYTYGKLFKRSKTKLTIYIKQDKKTLSKLTLKQGIKQFIDASNTHECLDEIITFLHHLPDAIIEKRPFDVTIPTTNLLLTYQIK